MAEAAAAPYAQVMEDMAKGREYATQLQALLRDASPEAGRLLDRILHAMARTIDTAKAAAEEQEASEVQSDVTCAGTAGGNGKRKAAGSGDKRAACRKRNNQSSAVTKSARDLDDGHAWRKYGQKEIQNCKHPKAYFRCTHKYDQNCLAQRQVQRRDDDPDLYTVTYIGVHTCRDPAAITPLVVHAAAGEDLHHAGSRLISFAAANASGATTSTTTTGNTTAHKNDAGMLARPLKLEGEQEEVLSSLTPAGNAAAAATPGPDQGDVTSGLQQLQQQEQCYGGDVVADMAAHLGYDDDTFDWMAVCSDTITDIYPGY